MKANILFCFFFELAKLFLIFAENVKKKKRKKEKCNLFIFIVSRRKAEMVEYVLTAVEIVGMHMHSNTHSLTHKHIHSSHGNVFLNMHGARARMHVKVSIHLFINNSFA